MSSPTLDLDMNLDSPSWKDSGLAGAPPAGGGAVTVVGNVGEIQLASNNASVNETLSDTPVETSRSSECSEIIVQKITAAIDDENNAVGESKKPDRHNLEEMLALVETWREEVNVMSVNNAISLDDLVKVGADV